MGSITLRAVSKTFGSTTVLRDINLVIQEGEFVVVVGPSGCGKSTLLRIVAGLERATSGHTLLDDRPIDNMPPYHRNIGMVFQNYALYPHMTVYDNLAFGMSAHKVPKKEIQTRIGQVAELLELQTLLRAKPSTLSGGQRQRVAVGRALVRQPHAFLMDEPLSNLDALLRERMRVELRRLHERLRIPTLYVTHDQTEAMTLADKLAVMRAGEVLQVGTPKTVYQQPATVFVAKFLGSPPMNLVRVESRTRGAMNPVGGAEEAVAMPAWIQEGWEDATDENGTIWCGFRPESVMKRRGPGGLEIPITVEAVETLGPRCHVHGSWGGQPITLTAEDGAMWTRGAVMRVAVPWDQVHWFHGRTERRIEPRPARLETLETGGAG
ncbi:MAG: sn-glycerol-3-phosphate ABC transporter ATP-binding protein UgpC [Thermaerobacter sp.]|nr:sn-glycerol-3-phosphate ABC transporter ATP-binding protein UgpC [Thermaerobacter sp.]